MKLILRLNSFMHSFPMSYELTHLWPIALRLFIFKPQTFYT
jgi:hypothetical protein